MEKTVIDIFSDPTKPGSFYGPEKISKSHGVPYEEAKRALEKIKQYTLYKQVHKKPKRWRKVIVHFNNFQVTADLIDLRRLKKYNKNYEYILTFLDCFSRKAYCEKLKNKTTPIVLEALKKIFNQLEKKPKYFFSDQESAFMSKVIQSWFKENDVIFFVSFSPVHSGIVERFNRTLMSRIAKYLDFSETLEWISVLDKLVESYNNTYHSSIGMSPNEVNRTNEHIVWDKLYKKYMGQVDEPKFKVGDLVRLATERTKFEKGYLRGWTDEKFVIKQVVPNPVPSYILEDLKGEPIYGSFTENELNLATENGE